jgi:hypothetical protein
MGEKAQWKTQRLSDAGEEIGKWKLRSKHGKDYVTKRACMSRHRTVKQKHCVTSQINYLYMWQSAQAYICQWRKKSKLLPWRQNQEIILRVLLYTKQIRFFCLSVSCLKPQRLKCTSGCVLPVWNVFGHAQRTTQIEMYENWVRRGMFGPQRHEGVGTGADRIVKSFALCTLQKLLSRL